MPGVDEKLRTELARAGVPADPSDAFERVVHKKVRRKLVRRLERGLLAVVVIAGTLGGVAALSRAFRGAEQQRVPRGAASSNGAIVFSMSESVGEPPHLYSIQPDGNGLVQLSNDSRFGDWQPAWSPDGGRIAVTRSDRMDFSSRAIWTMDADGGNLQRLTDPEMHAMKPAWSPDGTQIAFIATSGGRQSQVFLMNIDGSNVHALPGEFNDAVSPTWSPDGTRIAFAATQPMGDLNTYDVYVVGVDGQGPANLTRTPDASELWPSWSPDGTTIAVPAKIPRTDTRTFSLGLVPADGADRWRSVHGPDGLVVLTTQPAWAPDGTLIAFTDDEGLWTISPDGSNLSQVMEAERALSPTWQPVPAEAAMSPALEPTTSETVATPPPGDVASELPGVGAVCGLSRTTGDFLGDGTVGTAYVFEPEPEGGCDGPNENFQYIGVAPTGDRVKIVSSELRDCGVPSSTKGCRIFAAPDVDGDGVSEIAVVADDGSTPGSTQFELYAVAGASVIQRLAFDCSNCNDGVFLWGGPGAHVEGVYCRPNNAAGDFATWTAERTDAGDQYSLTEIVIDVKGPFLSQVDRRDSFVPYDPAALPPGGADDFCGAPVNG